MDIVTKKADGVLAIELNRPAKKNSINAPMYQMMIDAIEEGESDPAVRALLIYGKPDVFTAGNDLDEFIDAPPTRAHDPVYRFLDRISHAQKPLVAAVTGAAVGIGTTMLLHCDLVYAGDNATFSLPFVSLGVVPEGASSYLLPLTAGYQRAAELLLLAKPFGVDVAREFGFITQVVPAAEVLPVAQKAAARLASLPVASVRTTKALLRRVYRQPTDEQLQVEGDYFRKMLTEPAAREAAAAFRERRQPDFTKIA